MRLLLVEPGASGHHLTAYTRFITRAAVERGWAVDLLTTASSVNHPAFKVVTREVPTGMRTFVMPEVAAVESSRVTSLLHQQLRHFYATKRGFRAIPGSPPDMIYIVTLDNYEKVLGCLGSPFGGHLYGGMLVNPKYHRKAMGIGPAGRSDTIYERLFRRMLRSTNLACATVVDESFFEYAMHAGRNEYSKLRLVPEIGELSHRVARADARAGLGLGPGRFVVLVYGGISARKGIAELLTALDRFETAATVLIAGKQYDDVQLFLRGDVAVRLRTQGRLIESNEFQSEEMEAHAFAAADAVWLGYTRGFYGSSGVLFQAASAGLPVLACDQGLIGWLTRRHNLGVTLDPMQASSVHEAVRALGNDYKARRQFGENGRLLAKAHSGDVFGRAVCDALVSGHARGGRIKVA